MASTSRETNDTCKTAWAAEPERQVPVPKKPIANLDSQGLLDISLLTANVAQLKLVLDQGVEQRYFYVLVILLCLSITLQVVLAAMLVSKYGQSVEDDDDEGLRGKSLTRFNNWTTILSLFITVINIVVSAFGISVINISTGGPGNGSAT
ncbi:PREDICTED: ninjurin-2-like [Branchiostoma belcheri]|uniref:Ninjurin-2-like n=1 Tax=Branchiostoma belcheri TaxID=7741 RepID=A0A6P5A1E5_BRABE|nr:PREDICTED: ninjurin-2-like [Branchiostoma belcheri]